MKRLATAAVLAVATLVGVEEAHAHNRAQGVGLGVAAGVNLADADNIDLDTSFSWGFFVDIPLIETFYITPAATLYQIDNGDGESQSITDIDLNFKFIVPVGALSFGIGGTFGLTTGLGDYQPHYGGLGYVGFNIVSNLDLFAMVQYKRLTTNNDLPDYNNIHIYGGTMFRF